MKLKNVIEKTIWTTDVLSPHVFERMTGVPNSKGERGADFFIFDFIF